VDDSNKGPVAEEPRRRTQVVTKLYSDEAAKLDYCCRKLVMSRGGFFRMIVEQVSQGGFVAGDLKIEFEPFKEK